eukprot:Phypoly_transcript_08613.p1 GENE.Phypoly_transcript_08613~~Phypoly_transcript_08613.p1  ORF type:complete len:437 (+),score=100.60 Phypoly_transcript_08613:142-1311(+)
MSFPTLPPRVFNSALEEPAPHGTGGEQPEGAPKRPPPKVPNLEDKNEDISFLSEGMKKFLVDDKPIVPDVFSDTDFGNFEPVRAPPPAIPKRTRKTKAEREKEKLEGKPENQAHVPPHLQNPAENFRYRILMARIEGPEEMKKIEQEIEDNFQKGENDKNKAAIESGLLQTQWKLRPLGFHSKWLWSLARKYCGDDFAVKYLVQSRKNLYNWYLFAPTRQICLWRDCVDDLITTANDSLAAKKITVADLLDCISVYHVDTEERNQYTYLEDQITGYKPPHCSEKVKLLQDSIKDEYLVEMYSKMVIDFQPLMKLCTEEQFLDVLRPAMERMTPSGIAKLGQVMDQDNATEIRHMPIVRQLFGLAAKPKPLPPPFVPPPEPAKPKVPSEF